MCGVLRDVAGGGLVPFAFVDAPFHVNGLFFHEFGCLSPFTCLLRLPRHSHEFRQFPFEVFRVCV